MAIKWIAMLVEFDDDDASFDLGFHDPMSAVGMIIKRRFDRLMINPQQRAARRVGLLGHGSFQWVTEAAFLLLRVTGIPPISISPDGR